MKYTIVRRAALVACSCSAISGALACNSSGGGWKQTDDPAELRSTGSADIQDFDKAIPELINKMMASQPFQDEMARLHDVLPRGKKPLIKITRLQNNTTERIDLDAFWFQPVKEVLNDSGKVSFVSEDDLGAQIAGFKEGRTRTEPRLPDLVMYGKLATLRRGSGDEKQVAYSFTMELASTDDNSIIWTGGSRVVKVNGRPGFGL